MSALSSDRFRVSIWFSGLGIPRNFNTLIMSYLINVQQSILTSLHGNIETKASVSTSRKKGQLAIAWRYCAVPKLNWCTTFSRQRYHQQDQRCCNESSSWKHIWPQHRTNQQTRIFLKHVLKAPRMICTLWQYVAIRQLLNVFNLVEC